MKSQLSGLGGFLPMYHAPRGKGFFLPWLLSIFGPGKKGFFVKGLFGEEKLEFLGFVRCFFS